MAMILIICLLFLNLFVGVVIETFNRENAMLSKNNLLTRSQSVWLHLQIMTLKAIPYKRLDKSGYSWCRIKAVKFVRNPNFDKSILAAIILNTIILTMRWYMQPEYYEQPLDVINFIFMSIFTLEAIIKLYALRCEYFDEPWNVFDFFIVVLTLGILGLEFSGVAQDIGAVSTILRTLRICRVFRIVRRLKKL